MIIKNYIALSLVEFTNHLKLFQLSLEKKKLNKLFK